MGQNYSLKNYNKDNMARAFGRSLPISFKQSIEICNFIRNKKVDYAKNVLRRVIDHKQAIPFKRFNDNTGHKKNMMAGRYPEKASMEILSLLSSAESNAQFKGLNTSNLEIMHITANKASKAIHSGRKKSRLAKRTNLEIVVQEIAADKNLTVKKESADIKSKKAAKHEKTGTEKLKSKEISSDKKGKIKLKND